MQRVISAVWTAPEVDHGISKYPFVVRILLDGQFKNLGTLISDSLVITSSDNIVDWQNPNTTTSPKGKIVVESGTGSSREIDEGIRLGGCGTIAILKLKSPISLEGESIKTVELMDKTDRVKAKNEGEIINWNENHGLRAYGVHDMKHKCGIYQKNYPELIAICLYACFPSLKDGILPVDGAPYMIDGKQAGLVILSEDEDPRVRIKTFAELAKSDEDGSDTFYPTLLDD